MTYNITYIMNYIMTYDITHIKTYITTYIKTYITTYITTYIITYFQRKCECYWPNEISETKTYGNIKVSYTSAEKTSDFIIRSFEITHVCYLIASGLHLIANSILIVSINLRVIAT